jgi:hypothetical protein
MCSSINIADNVGAGGDTHPELAGQDMAHHTGVLR